MNLQEYIVEHATRGACCCGQCADAPPNPQEMQPRGHTADLCFFKVSAKNNPDADMLKTLIKSYTTDPVVDLFDKQEHSFIELGGWIGSQQLALMLMGLGTILGLWRLMTPRMLPGLPTDMVMQLAGSGLVTIQA